MEQGVFIKKVQSPFWFRFFLLKALPAAFFAGIKIRSLSSESASISIRFSWLTQNPFKSIYFACLAMAAEMSSGILAIIHSQHIKPSISMLVVGMKVDFHKKAVGQILFECQDGNLILAAIEKSMQTQAGQTITTHSVGLNAEGVCVADFYITWSFKQKYKIV
jgi:hypothetical protein